MDSELQKLGLKRHKDVGKKMGKHIWMHISYADSYVPGNVISDLIEKGKESVPDFNPVIVRIDHSSSEVALIESIDFDLEEEPAVGTSICFREDGCRVTKPAKNPLIYHHKWMFVQDDYLGFSVTGSKARSMAWKQHLGVNQHVSSRIGRKSFWDAWIASELPHLSQEFTSKNTSINAKRLPKGLRASVEKNLIKTGFVNLDIGGGKYDNATLYLKEKGITNLVYDPFNRTPTHNQNIISEIKNGVDSVGIHNVLNVIKEPMIRNSLLRMAFEYLKVNGVLCISIYEGTDADKLSRTGRKTGSDQWQNFMQKEDYIPEIMKVFGNVKVQYGLLIAIKSE